MSRILITGGAGFVGSHLAEACVKADHQVHVILRPGSPDDRLRKIADRLTCHRIDLRSDADVRIACRMSARTSFITSPPRRGGRPASRWRMPGTISGKISIASFRCSAPPPARAVRLRTHPRRIAGRIWQRAAALSRGCAGSAGHGLWRWHARGDALCWRAAGEAAVSRSRPRGWRSSTVRRNPPTTCCRLLIKQCLAGEASAIRRPDDRRDLLFVADAVAALMRMATVVPAAGRRGQHLHRHRADDARGRGLGARRVPAPIQT